MVVVHIEFFLTRKILHGTQKAARTSFIKDDNKSCSRAYHDYCYYYCYDAEDKDDYTDDAHTANAVICVDFFFFFFFFFFFYTYKKLHSQVTN